MDYTQMRFKDLLVSDLGSLPPDAHINEELYNLLTLPYTLGSDMNTRLTTHKYQSQSSERRFTILICIRNIPERE